MSTALCFPRCRRSSVLLILSFLLRVSVGTTMESNVPSNAPSSDIMRGLSDIDLTRLKAVREELFLTSKELNLTDSRDVLVNRKDTVVNPIRKKIIDDIIRPDRCMFCLHF